MWMTHLGWIIPVVILILFIFALKRGQKPFKHPHR